MRSRNATSLVVYRRRVVRRLRFQRTQDLAAFDSFQIGLEYARTIRVVSDPVRISPLHLNRSFPASTGLDAMAPSSNTNVSVARPRTSDRDGRPATYDQTDPAFVIPSRTSSLHSRIVQPFPSTLSHKPTLRTPKTLTHAYMVCGVGREPSQWVRAPPPGQGKIQHMKSAVGQFWLPEILGSSPRLEQDNEVARSLYAAMRVNPPWVDGCEGSGR